MRRIVKARLEYYTALVVFLLILISFVAIELYASMIYAEVNKKKSFLAYITGKPLFQRHKTYYFMTAGISSGVLGIYSYGRRTYGRLHWLYSALSCFCYSQRLIYLEKATAWRWSKMIDVRKITKKYKEKTIFEHLSFFCARGFYACHHRRKWDR